MKKLLFGIAVAVLAFTIAVVGLQTGGKAGLQLVLQPDKAYTLWLNSERRYTPGLLEEDSGTRDWSCQEHYEISLDTSKTAEDGIPPVRVRVSGRSGSTGAGPGLILFKLSSVWPDTAACRKLMQKELAVTAGDGMLACLTPWKPVPLENTLKKLMARIKDLPEPTEPFIRQAHLEGSRELMAEGGGNRIFHPALVRVRGLFPAKPVRVGDTWTARMEAAAAWPMILIDSLKLLDRNAGVATVELRSSLKPNPAAEAVDTAGLELRQFFSGEQRGTLKLDENTGLLLEGNLEQRLSGEIRLTGLEGRPEEISVPLAVEQNIKIEVSEKPLESSPIGRNRGRRLPDSAGSPRDTISGK